MTGYTPGPDIVPSPWLDDISDEAAAILAQTLLDLAMACEDRYERHIHRHRERLRAKFINPDRPWMRRSVASDEDLSRDDTEAFAADFNARQLDLFRPEAEWDNDF
jgi:hypothetical protein